MGLGLNGYSVTIFFDFTRKGPRIFGVTSHRTIASERSERAAAEGPLYMTVVCNGVTVREESHYG